MAKARGKPAPLKALGRQYLAIRREAQRVMLSRLRREHGRRHYGHRYLPQSVVAAEAGISVDHLRNFESGETLLGEEMRVRLMVAYGLTPAEWARRETKIVADLEAAGVNLQISLEWAADREPTTDPGNDES